MADGMPGQQARTRRISLIFFDAGGGHRNAATALKVQIERRGLPFEVTLVNLQEVLDPLDILRKLTGIQIQDMYNDILRNGWTLGSPQLLRVLQLVIRTYHGPTVKLLEGLCKLVMTIRRVRGVTARSISTASRAKPVSGRRGNGRISACRWPSAASNNS